MRKGKRKLPFYLMQSLPIKESRRMVVLKRKDVTLGVIKLIRSLNKREPTKRFLLAELGKPLDNVTNPKHAIMKLKDLTWAENGDLLGLVCAADNGCPTVHFSDSDEAISIGQILLSSLKPTFEFKVHEYKRDVLLDGKPVFDECGRKQRFKNTCLYVESH